jgi:CRP/FNR family transcriptional regulator, cyclic AMP receptor protein
MVMVNAGVAARIDQLASAKVFRPLGQAILTDLAEAATQRKLPEDTPLIHLGDVPSYLYIIVRGKVRLSVPLPDGREFIFSDIGPGDVFDLSSLFGSRHCIMDAASISQSDVLQLEVPFVTYLFRKYPDFAVKLLPFLCQSAQDAQERVIEGTSHTLAIRLAITLLRITKKPHGIAIVGAEPQHIRLSQTDLAAMVPASREKVNRCLREWERRALVQCQQGSLKILNREALKFIALGGMNNGAPNWGPRGAIATPH